MDLPKSQLTRSQTKTFHKKIESERWDMTVRIRYDDECGNDHNSFAITADIYRLGRPKTDGNAVMMGCCHDEVARFFPELEPFLKWHLTSSDGPMHYIANTIYHASEIKKFNYFVYLEDQTIKKSGHSVMLGLYSEAELQEVNDRFEGFSLRIEEQPMYCNKDANLEAARSCAVWPDASLEDLLDEEKLKARLPALMEEFKRDVESLGFTY